jgi:hypothetical protein
MYLNEMYNKICIGKLFFYLINNKNLQLFYKLMC